MESLEGKYFNLNLPILLLWGRTFENKTLPKAKIPASARPPPPPPPHHPTLLDFCGKNSRTPESLLATTC